MPAGRKEFRMERNNLRNYCNFMRAQTPVPASSDINETRWSIFCRIFNISRCRYE